MKAPPDRQSWFDIIVAGGGPVGTAAAAGLAQAGFTVALIEPGSAPKYIPEVYDARVYALAPATRALLRRLGVWSQIVETRAQAYVGMRVWTAAPQRALRFDAELAYEPLGWIVEHSLLTAALWSALDGVTVISAAVSGLQLAEGCASLTLADGRQLESRLLVAADGAESMLRTLAGIETLGWDYRQRAIVAQVSTTAPHQSLALQRFLNTGPLAFLPLADGSRSIVWSADDALAAELEALDDAAFVDGLDRAAQGVPGRVESVSKRWVVDLKLRQARHYAAPGIVIVGDAAHVLHPLAGQGANLGLGDVAELIDVLTNARNVGRDWSGLRSLRRFERARMANALEMLATTDLLQKAFGSRLPGMRTMLGLGLGVVDRLPPLRRWLATRASVG